MRILIDIPEQFKERVDVLLARISTLNIEVSAIEEQMAKVGHSVENAGRELQESIRELQDSIIAEEAGLSIANKKLSAQQSKLSIQEEKDKILLSQLLESRRIKLSAIDLLNSELYKNLCTEIYLFRCEEFIQQSELAIEHFKSSVGINPDIILRIIRLDNTGESLNAYGSEFWGVYISPDYGYLYSSVRSVFYLKSELKFQDMADSNILYDKLLEKYIKPFEVAVKHCKSIYADFITRRFEDKQLVNNLRNSQLTTEQRTHLSMWIPNL